MTEWDRAYTVRRYSRTTEEAFGPGHRSSYGVEPMRDPPMPASEVALYVVSVIAVIVLCALPFMQ